MLVAAASAMPAYLLVCRLLSLGLQTEICKKKEVPRVSALFGCLEDWESSRISEN